MKTLFFFELKENKIQNKIINKNINKNKKPKKFIKNKK